MLSVVLEIRRDGGDDPRPLSRDTVYLLIVDEHQGELVFPWDEGQLDTELRIVIDQPAERAARIQRLGSDLRNALLETALWHGIETTCEAAIQSGQMVLLSIHSSAPEVHDIPWELLSRPTGVSISDTDGYVVRYSRIQRLLAQAIQPTSEVGALVLAASTVGGNVPVDQHERALRTATELGRATDLVIREKETLRTPLSLRQALDAAARDGLPARALVVLCHGRVNDAGIVELAWHGDGGQQQHVDPNALAGALQTSMAGLRLIVLAMCHGGAAAQNSTYRIGSFARVLHAQGHPMVIGCRYPLSRAGSVVLTRELFAALLQGESLERAFARARTAMRQSFPQEIDWSGLQLYVDPTLTDHRPITIRPYRGLRYFDRRHHALFKGRDEERKVLVERADELRTQVERFYLIAGSSGAGKSSLLRAGLLAALDAEGWRCIESRPLASPIVSLWTSVCGDAARPQNPEALARGLLEALSGDRPACLAIDQLEELFATAVSAEVREAYVSLVWRLATEPGGPVVFATMRADQQYGLTQVSIGDGRKLWSAVTPSDRHMLLAPLDMEKLRVAVLEPAEAVGLRFDPPTLVNTIVDDAEGSMPLVEYALDQLWLRRVGNALRAEEYAALGGVKGALVRDARALLDELRTLKGPHLEVARRLLLEMVDIRESGARDTRRQANVEQVRGALRGKARRAFPTVLEKLVAARLVAVDERGTAELSHETLIRDWPELRTWVAEERERRRRHGERVALLIAAAAVIGMVLFGGIGIYALVERGNARENAKKAQQSEGKARQNRVDALVELAKSLGDPLEASLIYGELAKATPTDPLAGIFARGLGNRPMPVSSFRPADDRVDGVARLAFAPDGASLIALYRNGQAWLLSTGAGTEPFKIGDSVFSVVIDQTGRDRALVVTSDGAAKLWSLSQPSSDPVPVFPKGEPPLGAAIAGDRAVLARGGAAPTISVASVSGHGEAFTLSAGSLAVEKIVIAEGGTRAVWIGPGADADAAPVLWAVDLSRGAQPRNIGGPHGSDDWEDTPIFLSYDGSRLIGFMQEWDLDRAIQTHGSMAERLVVAMDSRADCRLVTENKALHFTEACGSAAREVADREPRPFDPSTSTYALSRDGKVAVVGQADGVVQVVSPRRASSVPGTLRTFTTALVRSLERHRSRVSAVAVHGGSGLVATAAEDGEIRIWSLQDRAGEAEVGFTDGERVVTTSGGSAHLRSITSTASKPFSSDEIAQVWFRPDFIVTLEAEASADPKSLPEPWETRPTKLCAYRSSSGERIACCAQAPTNRATTVAISPDGDRLYVGHSFGNVAMWALPSCVARELLPRAGWGPVTELAFDESTVLAKRGYELVVVTGSHVERRPLKSAAVTPRGDVLVSISEADALEVRARADGWRPREVARVPENTNLLEITPDGDVALACGPGRCARIMIATGDEPPIWFPSTSGVVGFSDDGRLLVTAPSQRTGNPTSGISVWSMMTGNHVDFPVVDFPLMDVDSLVSPRRQSRVWLSSGRLTPTWSVPASRPHGARRFTSFAIDWGTVASELGQHTGICLDPSRRGTLLNEARQIAEDKAAACRRGRAGVRVARDSSVPDRPMVVPVLRPMPARSTHIVLAFTFNANTMGLVDADDVKERTSQHKELLQNFDAAVKEWEGDTLVRLQSKSAGSIRNAIYRAVVRIPETKFQEISSEDPEAGLIVTAMPTTAEARVAFTCAADTFNSIELVTRPRRLGQVFDMSVRRDSRNDGAATSLLDLMSGACSALSRASRKKLAVDQPHLADLAFALPVSWAQRAHEAAKANVPPGMIESARGRSLTPEVLRAALGDGVSLR